MAELNLNQIESKLNEEFKPNSHRKLIFWYDNNAEFVADIDSISLTNAKIHYLEKDNQFLTKYLLERQDPTTNYLIYAPFPKPALIENHLADTIRYSKEFFADRASLITADLGIDDKYKDVIAKYIKFFGAKDRTQKFYALEIDHFNKNLIEIGIMSVICKVKNTSFEEVLRVVINDMNNKYLAEFDKYNITEAFWRMCTEMFGERTDASSLLVLVYTLFVTYMSKVIPEELPQELSNYKSHKSGNVVAFLDSIMNSIVYTDNFTKLSNMVYDDLNIENVIIELNINSLVNLDIFVAVDKKIINWIIERLLHENLGATIGEYNIPKICQHRRKLHFKEKTMIHYHLLENAFYIVSCSHFSPKQQRDEIYNSYVEKDYIVDSQYRLFYTYYDKLESNEIYDDLVQLVENIYTNRFLNPLAVAWSNALSQTSEMTDYQLSFYNDYVRSLKERVVVIISDALRYEVGKALFEKLQADEKCEMVKIHSMQSMLPSYTRLGMSALLPYTTLKMNEKYEILVDEKKRDDLKSREEVLKSGNKNSKAIRFDDVKTAKEAKKIIKGQEVVYMYHNQIDARGDKLATENEVFVACEEAIKEIHNMIKRLSSANNTRFIITSDHGFIYKREKLTASNKITVPKDSFKGRRYIVSAKDLKIEGTYKILLGTIFQNQDTRNVYLPIGSDVFDIAGGGSNYVHGGGSLQEMIVPVIEVKTNKYHMGTQNVTIAMVSILKKVTNLNLNVDFIQTEPVTDVNKETSYKLYFIADDGEKISSDNIYIADKKEGDTHNRIFRLNFTFKNQKYSNTKKYYLVAVDEKSSLEIMRHEVKMDLVFVDYYGF
ncbi:TIGR02687 family protein [Candidatus Epulonipiscium fishelsonii]|uniref:TIGR02687 family protein n=1 Tax=Candidatus Epulonipiscium fishelsonii TaxID=77094 RepID=A0ACC8X9U9_9FIRM|nr:TIGR02687 family protein [Epulopiscium sp. SCG-B11WGA-EpuloA1]ONI42015.1 TIGR02687 family protein [Epulopiscium sp. SCG-B05WGA-EpuloA1]